MENLSILVKPTLVAASSQKILCKKSLFSKLLRKSKHEVYGKFSARAEVIFISLYTLVVRLAKALIALSRMSVRCLPLPACNNIS